MMIERLRAIGEYQDYGHLQTNEELQTHLFIYQESYSFLSLKDLHILDNALNY